MDVRSYGKSPDIHLNMKIRMYDLPEHYKVYDLPENYKVYHLSEIENTIKKAYYQKCNSFFNSQRRNPKKAYYQIYNSFLAVKG